MLTTVQFDDQLCLCTEEIDHITTDRSLAPKPESAQLPVSYRMPQLTFHVGHIAAQPGGVGTD
jgi:hypothetical protein